MRKNRNVNKAKMKEQTKASPQLKLRQHEWGTYEWSSYTLNFITGCEHSCKYCYSKEMMVRYKKVTPQSWELEQVRQHDLNKKIKKYEGKVMFPSSHDIAPTYLEESIIFLRKILEAGNDVLIVSKPHLECIKRICKG